MHGRGFKPAREDLENLSFAALRAGIERDYPDCVSTFDEALKAQAYYGDLSGQLLESAGSAYDVQLDIGDRQNALRTLKEIPARKRFGIRQYDRLPGKSAIGEFLADVGAPLLGPLGLWMWMCRRCSHDFAAYLDNRDGYADGVRNRVRKALVDAMLRDGELALVTHGTGSVVAWDVLWELSHDEAHRDVVGERKVAVWVTLGSPLGDEQLRKRISGASTNASERFPSNVIAWYNVSAEDDYTCHDKTLADDYRRMMSEHLVSAVIDYKIYNHAVRYGKSNPHSSIGYYIHPRVSRILADWLGTGG